MPTDALMIMAAAAMILIAVFGIRSARNRRHGQAVADRRNEIERIRLDEDTSEIRRGDRPEPPASPTVSAPDNLAPFARPSSDDERR